MKRWIIAEKKSDDIIEQLLINRGIGPKGRDIFLNPDFERDILDPFLLNGMLLAVNRILDAINKNEKIGIFTDFDADGIPGGAIIYKLLKEIGIIPEVYIPTRVAGYGLSIEGIKELISKKCKLIIAIDLGITGKKEIEEAKKLGADIIVCDHHEFDKNNLPTDAFALLHPMLSPKYQNKYLAGGGVAWKLAQAIISKLKTKPVSSSQGKNEKLKTLEKWLLDLAAISTICDMVPIIGENRVIVKYGLVVLNKTKNVGLKAIYEQARITSTIDTYSVGFLIGPRINAPGRLEEATSSFHILVEDDFETARKISGDLEIANRQRQNMLDKILLEAKKKIKKRGLENNKVIVIEGKNWPPGLVGLIAGRLMDQFCRPVIVFSQNGNKLKGSARSVDNFHLLEALARAEQYLIKHGGHAKAAGITMELKHLKSLYDCLLSWADRRLTKEDLEPKIKIDAEINFANQEIDSKFTKEIKKFEPFGMGNPRPVFVSYNVIVKDKRLVGSENKHLKLKLVVGNKIIDAIGFDLGNYEENLKANDKIDIVYTIDENVWNGNVSTQFKILDFCIKS